MKNLTLNDISGLRLELPTAFPLPRPKRTKYLGSHYPISNERIHDQKLKLKNVTGQQIIQIITGKPNLKVGWNTNVKLKSNILNNLFPNKYLNMRFYHLPWNSMSNTARNKTIHQTKLSIKSYKYIISFKMPSKMIFKITLPINFMFSKKAVVNN